MSVIARTPSLIYHMIKMTFPRKTNMANEATQPQNHMNLLPPSTVRLITSSQVITSVSSAVKELIENSLDAGATSIEIKLDGWGLERIEVRDNGCGIKPEDAPFIAQPHYTSKISSDIDLKSLSTYGFRGEALGSLASVSSVSVLTKTESEQVGMLYTLDHSGKIEATQPKPAATGSTVIATNLFKNLPVRKQFSSNSKKCKEELKKVEDLVMAYGLVHPFLRIWLRHNKTVVWQKNKVSNHRTALLSVFGTALLAQMGVIEFHNEVNSGIHVLGYLPKPGADLEITGRAMNDRCFVFFNGRPVNMKQISQLIKQYYNSHTSGTSNRHPVAFLSVQIPLDSIDVNLEPNKTSVMLTNNDELITLLTNLLDEFYSDEMNRISESKTSAASNGAKHGAVSSKNGFHVNKESVNGGVTCAQSSNNPGAVDDEVNDVEVSSMPKFNGDITVCMSKSANNKGNKDRTATCLDKNMSFENTQRRDCSEEGTSNAGRHLDNDALSNVHVTHNGNDLLKEGASCQHEAKPDSQCKDTCTCRSSKSPNVEEELTEANVNGHKDNAAHLLSPQQDNANALANPESCLACPFDSTECREELSDKTLCELSESDVVDVTTSDVTENGNCKTSDGVSNLNVKDPSQDISVGGHSEKSQDVLDNSTLKHTPSTVESVEKLFSLDMDDLFDDSNLNLTDANSNRTSSRAQSEEKHKSMEISSSTPIKDSESAKEFLPMAAAPAGTEQSKCSDKDWSMGRGIVDKQGNAVEPVILLTPSVPCYRTPAAPLLGKRKQPSDQSRLSLSSKKIKKSPEITNQPLITKIMSPNPMQRKLLYKKTEIPFCLSTLKQLAKSQRNGQSSVEQDSSSDCLIGRLDPWGVWLLRKGTDIVCVNQYRVQEQLLFQRLMESHSLPKESINHPIALNERVVGGSESWRTLCSMRTTCDPPGTTRCIDDERLTSNGFDVCLKTDSESGETKLELTKISIGIPFYGVPDLAEVLELVRQKGDGGSSSLSNCRPFKVLHHLQGEAVRMARSLSSRMSRSDVSDIISRMEGQIPQDTRACAHGRPFFEKIAKIPKN